MSFLRSTATRYFTTVRTLTRNVVRYEKAVAESVQEAASGKLSRRIHRVNNFEKKMLVWTGKYKTTADVPAYLAPETVDKARNRIRIRVAIGMMLLTALGCVAMVISGKRAAARGESVQKANLEWHRKYNEEAKKNEK